MEDRGGGVQLRRWEGVQVGSERARNCFAALSGLQPREAANLCSLLLPPPTVCAPHIELGAGLLDLKPLNQARRRLLHAADLPQVQALLVVLRLRQLRDLAPQAAQVGWACTQQSREAAVSGVIGCWMAHIGFFPTAAAQCALSGHNQT